VLSLEGWFYAIVGAALGGLAGLGIGELVVLVARTVFTTQAIGRVDLVFSARPASVALGFAIGFLGALVVVVSAAVVASRRNIVRMIKGLADPPRPLVATSRRVVGGALVVGGIATLAAGLVASNGVASVIGPAAGAIGLVLLIVVPGRVRLGASLAAVAVFAWSALAITVVHGAFSGLSVAVVATEGAVLSACAVALVSLNHAAITRRWSEPRGRRALSFGIGLAYSRTAPKRTVLIVSMYAVAIFTLTLLVTIGQLYNHNVDAVARRLGGAAALEVTSDATRPVPVRDVVEMPGVTRVTAASAINAQLQDGPATAPVPVTVVGFDPSFVGHGSPPRPGGSGDSLFAHVARDPGQVIVGTDLRADLQSGLPGSSVQVGDKVSVRDPLTGAASTLTVAGLVNAARWAGVDHVYAARAVADALSGGSAPANLLYVETAAGTNNDVVAAIVDGTHLPNGAYARSFSTLARDTLSAQRQFLDIGAGYATVGLLADLAGIGVLMIDRVRERRWQIAMLRALGFRGRTVRRAFRIESVVIAAEGIIVGLVTGLVLAWRLGASGGLGRRLSFSLPIAALVVITVAVLIATLVATTVPARRAGRLRPAGALRSDE
jgi:putative ABC transport system permease protein